MALTLSQCPPSDDDAEIIHQCVPSHGDADDFHWAYLEPRIFRARQEPSQLFPVKAVEELNFGSGITTFGSLTTST